jgi:hypothetical protein
MNTIQKIQRVAVLVLAIGVLIIATEYAGFNIGGNAASKKQLINDGSLLWILTICFGAAGGLILKPKKFMATIPSGIVSACGVTGSVLLYLSFRKSIYQAELVIPLLIGIFPGMIVYPLFHKLIYKTEPENNAGEKGNAPAKTE